MYTAPSRSEKKETKFPKSSLHGVGVEQREKIHPTTQKKLLRMTLFRCRKCRLSQVCVVGDILSKLGDLCVIIGE